MKDILISLKYLEKQGEDYIWRTAKEAAEEIEHLRNLLDPRTWTKEMSDAWHRNIPDTQAAFNALREVKRKDKQ